MKRVLFFGIFDPDYARSRVLREGFEAHGYTVEMCRVDPRTHRGARKYWVLFQKGRVRRKERFDYVLVLFPGHTVVWLARLLFGKRIIFDVFVSLYDSNVSDRMRYHPWSLRALYDLFFDHLSCALAGTVLVDTEAHRRYFVARRLASPKKTLIVPVGASQVWFEAGAVSARAREPVTVGFYGSYIPLHGVQTIVRAAALLRDAPVRFELIGAGQEYTSVQKVAHDVGATNIVFTPRVSRDELIEKMRVADICLGIFGETRKASRVVPNKVYECAALGKPIVTADTPAVRAFFSDNELVLVPQDDSTKLAEAISALVINTTERRLLAAAVRKRMLACYSPIQ